MGKKSYYGTCKKKSWDKNIKKAIRDITDSVVSKIAFRSVLDQNACESAGARYCIYTLIIITLLFSGVGFYSWIIIGMLCLVLQFV